MEIMINMGILCNYGFEMEVRVNILNNLKGLIWDVIVNLFFVVNKIVKLFYNGNFNNCVGGYEVVIGCKKVDGIDEIKWIVGCQEGGKLGELVVYK